jgi:hypothetical protein
MLRNSTSGPEIGLPGRILAGLLPGKHQDRPSGRPKTGRMADLGAFPAAVRPKSGPGSPISGPDALLRNTEYELFIGMEMCPISLRGSPWRLSAPPWRQFWGPESAHGQPRKNAKLLSTRAPTWLCFVRQF